MVQVETLTSGWDAVRGTVFELEDELVEQLTELAQERPHGALRAVEVQEGEHETAEAADGEGEDAALTWVEAANEADPAPVGGLMLLTEVQEGVAPVARRPQRARRSEPYFFG